MTRTGTDGAGARAGAGAGLLGFLSDKALGVPRTDRADDRRAYARDLWPRHHLGVRAGNLPETSPAAVVWPRTTEEVATLVQTCHREGIPIVPFGAGSGVCGGILPDPRTVVLDLKRMEAVRSLRPEEDEITIESGAMGITLEERLQRRGLTVGHFPSSILCSTVGGWVAGRGAGQCSGRYGKIEDMVAHLELVDGTGEVRTLHRRPFGRDLVPLVVGSEGILGVITSATLRLHAAPAHRVFLSFVYPSTEAGWTAIRTLYQAGLRPAVARLYDPFDSFLARRGGVKRNEPGAGKAPGAGAKMLTRLLASPRALNGLVDLVGDKNLGGAMLVLVFEGPAAETTEDALRGARLAERAGGVSLGEGPAQRWYAHRYSVSYRQAPVFRIGAFSDTLEVAAPWAKLGDLYEGVRRALSRHVFVMAHLSHAYPDGCSIYFTFAGARPTEAACLETYDAAWRDALAAVVEAGGTISHHHGTGRSKAPKIPAELGAGVLAIKGLQRAFDPAGICNPGNLLPAQLPTFENDRVEIPRQLTLDEASLVLTAPAAARLDVVQTFLDARGYTLVLAADAELRGDETVGAWLERGAVGARDPWEDPVDHLVAGFTAELPSGQRFCVPMCPRRAAGPDLTALFVGPHGAFGRLLSADLRVARRAAPHDLDVDQMTRPMPFRGQRHLAETTGEQALFAKIETALR
jgi:alkyldihydroxyacetonephosphate synthase